MYLFRFLSVFEKKYMVMSRMYSLLTWGHKIFKKIKFFFFFFMGLERGAVVSLSYAVKVLNYLGKIWKVKKRPIGEVVIPMGPSLRRANL